MLTKLGIESLLLLENLPKKRKEHPAGKVGGLYLVVQPSRAASWALRYRFGGMPKKLTLGPYPALGLAEARRKAQEALGELAGGKDPSAAKKAARAAARAEREADHDLVEAVAKMFIERHARAKTRDWRETERMLNREVVGRWKGRRLSTLTRMHVHGMLDKIVDRAPIRANRVYAQFRKMCNFAVERGIIAVSPCVGVKMPSPERSRDRVLDDGEVRLVWQTFEAIGWPFGPIGKLLLLTAQRLGEVAGMRWSELDVAARTWTLSASRTKNKREHVVPMSDEAIEIIEALPRIEKSAFVFSTTGATPVSGFSRAKRTIDRTIVKLMREAAEARGDDPEGVAPPPGWRLHDIRRTVATGLQKLGIRLETTEACLNHVSGSRAGIVGVYQRHTYSREKRAALDAWSRRLAEIVSGEKASNVVKLASAQG